MNRGWLAMMRMIFAALFVLALPFGASAQAAKSLREQLVGTWNFVIAEITTADGKKQLPFGDRPRGMLVFTADGHFSQVHVANGLPRIASGNRLAGSVEENKAILAGSLALFGTYTVDEAKRTLTFHIEASTFPNLEGVAQTRTIE
jgi:lipocalin-like protein